MQTDADYFEEGYAKGKYRVPIFRKLYPLFAPHKWTFAAAVLLIMGGAVLHLLVPYITKIAIDRYIAPGTAHIKGANSETVVSTAYYPVSTNNDDIRDVVRRYPGLFKKRDGKTIISYRDMAKLEKKDLVILRQTDFSGVARMAALLLGIIGLILVVEFLRVMILEYMGQRIMHSLRIKLFDHMTRLSVSYFNKNPVGRLVTRVTNDIENLNEFFTSILVFLFKDFVLLIGIMGVLLYIHPRLASITFLVIPVMVGASLFFSGKVRTVYRKLRVLVARINSRTSETIDGMKIIQLFRREAENYRKFKELNRENYLMNIAQIRIFAVFMPIIELLGVIGTALVIFYGGRGVLSETVTLGVLVAFISYLKMFFRPLRDIAQKYNIMQNAIASVERIFLILDLNETLPEPETPAVNPESGFRIQTVEMEGVSLSYIPGEPVLSDISFRIEPGESVAFVGPTGAGKTSIINLIIRFYDPTSGRVLINGKDIRELGSRTIRNRMALVTQDPILFSGTIEENILQGGKPIDPEKMEKILKASNCRDFVYRMPEKWNTPISEGGASISSGERQLLSIARAFARDPDLIILDEATSYVDSETETKIETAAENLLRGRTSIIVAHRLSTARNADRIMVMKRGGIIESGTHDELMRKEGVYYKLYQLGA